MKITRITKLQHRVFRDFSWPNDLHPFARFNLIYGWNGCGKTTLSSLLSLIQEKTVLSEGEVELEFDEKTKVSGLNFGSAQLPQVRVFNRDFINATLQSGDGIAPIYFLGKDSAEKQAQIEKLRSDLSQVLRNIQIENENKNNATSKRDEFLISQAKIIKSILTTGNSPAYNNYDKRRFAQASEHLTQQRAAEAILSDAQKENYRKQKDAQPKPRIEKVISPSLDLSTLATEVAEAINRSVVAKTLDELNTNKELASWVQKGLALHSGQNASDVCRFCHKPFETARRSELESHFNDAFAEFQRDLDGLHSKLTKAVQIVSSLSLPDISRFYDNLHVEVTNASNAVATAKSKIEDTFVGFIASVEAKRANPFISTETTIDDDAMSDYLTAPIEAFNTAIDKHNRITDQFTASVAEACKKLEDAYVAEAHGEYRKLTQALTDAVKALDAIQDKPATIRQDIDDLERQIIEHRRPADELTSELHAYLGRDELRFEVKGNGYAITRNGQPVSHLSEGERTAITFLYFLKSLQDKSFDISSDIIVIDDPVSSLDANALFLAFGYMKERTKECGQLFILTHNFLFYRLVKNWFYHLPGQRKKKVDERPARFFLLRLCQHIDGLQTAHLGPLDRLLEQHESEYQYLFKQIFEAAHRTNVDSLEHYYGLPNIARRLLEAFLAFRFPEMSDDIRLKLDRIQFDTAKKTRILRLLHTYSHSEAIVEPEHDLSVLSETQPVLLDLLDLMKAEDEGHYLGLQKVVGDSDAVDAHGD